jgi:hypothetical protein
MDLITPFLTVTNLGIILASAGILAAIRNGIPSVDQHHLWARVQPVAPLVICTALVFLPSATDVGRWGDKVILGIALGSLSTLVYKTITQSVMGRDQRIQAMNGPVPMSEAVTPSLGAKP